MYNSTKTIIRNPHDGIGNYLSPHSRRLNNEPVRFTEEVLASDEAVADGLRSFSFSGASIRKARDPEPLTLKVQSLGNAWAGRASYPYTRDPKPHKRPEHHAVPRPYINPPKTCLFQDGYYEV